MARHSAGLLALFALTFISSLWAQSSSDTKRKPLPEFDVRDAAVTGAPIADQNQARSLVERRRAGLASFAASPQEARLGTRIVANSHGLPKLFLRDGHSLSAPSGLKADDIARGFLREQSSIFLLDGSEVDNLRVLVDDATDTGRFLSFNQTVNGLDVFNGLIKFTLNKDGEVIQVAAGDLIPGVQVNTTPALTAEEAIKAAYRTIGSPLSGTLAPASNPTGKTAFANPHGAGYSPITSELTVFPLTASSARLAYRLFIEVDSRSWYEILIDAETGGLLFRHNLYVSSGQGNVWKEFPTAGGSRTLVTFPDGWLPANGTVTTGNNVDAYLSTGTNDQPTVNAADLNMKNGRAYSATAVFDFPFGDGTIGANPRLSQAAGVTNLFYFVNVAHDYYYSLGFNEAAGNFQTDNLGRGGAGNDAVIAEAQVGDFTNDAAFAPTPEGIAPRIRMGLFTRGTASVNDDLDSDYDGQTIVHEYGHGVSNRLVGATTSTSCLTNIQSGAMGEGWSDYFSISFFNDPVIGAYIGQDAVKGIRRYSYEGYPLTYEDIGNGIYGYEVHDDGEIWAGTLWDLRKSLGQQTTDRLVIDGLKSTPCNPSMTDARDAILSADLADNKAANRKTIWTIFAKHGMGYSAVGVDGDQLTGTRYDAAYDLPPDLQSTPNPAITSNPLLIKTGSGDLYKYTVTASNPAGGTLSFALTSGPAGMAVDAKGNVTWTATFLMQRVKITVTDGSGGKVVHGYALPVVTNLTSGSPVNNIAGDLNSVGFAHMAVPDGTPVLQVTLRGGIGDADLILIGPDGSGYVSANDQTNAETISVPNPPAGTWTIAVVAYQAYSQVTLNSSLITPTLLSDNITLTGLSGDFTGETFYRIPVPGGAISLVVSTKGGTGDVDLFLKRGSACPPSAFCVDDDAYSARFGNIETMTINNPSPGDWYLDLYGYEAYSGVTLTITTTFAPVSVSSGGAARASTTDRGSALQAGYATATTIGGPAPFATAVFSQIQNGYTVTEAGIPATPPTASARIFIDYRTGVVTGGGTISISTGLAIANPAATIATLTYTLRDATGQTLAIGHGTLAANGHKSKFIQELHDIAPDFNLPSNFSTSILFGSLEIASSQPISILALRLTTNERGDTLFSSTSVADLSRPLGNTPLYFPQLVDGGGFVTSIVLANTSSSPETGTVAMFENGGKPVSVKPVGGAAGTSFPYSIPPAGFFVLQTDGSPTATQVGWVEVTPNSGSSPVGTGIFSYTLGGVVVTESGIPAAPTTTAARLYVDMSNGHDTGVAIANPGNAQANVTVKAFQRDGVTSAGSGPAILNVAANGHNAAYADQIVSGLPNGFTGVLELTSTTPFAVLTLRALANGRDTLFTTFPVADETQQAPSPIIFPQIADGGGFSTQFIFISASGAVSVSLNFIGDDGTGLPIAQTQ
jgi:Zn-dependent metalloprotease